MTKKQFHTQLQFVANFSTKVSIGPDDVRMSVITFSSSACVELSFNESKDNTSVIDALMNIAYKPGATRTDRALEKVNHHFRVFVSLDTNIVIVAMKIENLQYTVFSFVFHIV